jgi:glycosyltransferase involved in cell wall biosynthesis
MRTEPDRLANGGAAPPTPLDSLPLPLPVPDVPSGSRLAGKRVGMVVFSSYPADPRPRRAAEALLHEGMHLDLICEADGKLPKRESRDGLEIFRLPITHYRGSKLSYAYQYSAFILMSASFLAWHSLRRRYDLVYIHNMPDILVLSALLPKAFGAKVILDQHDPMPELMMTIFDLERDSFGVRVIRQLEKWSIARAHLVLTVNIACKRIFSSRSCRPEKIGVVMNSPDGEIFPYRTVRSNARSNQISTTPFVIMYHGSLVERNGLDLAVDALARLREAVPTAELRIYGRSTPFLEKVMDKARDLGLENCVRYLGPKSLEELVREIEACDVGVIPNHRNAFTDINTPTRIFEYLALGKPVIAPATPGIQDYYGPESLFFFESGNAEELAQKIEYVYSHASQASEIAERGQQVYLAHTWREERQTLVNLVSGLLDGDRRK